MIFPRSGSTACVRRSRPCLAEPPAESPSTRKSSRNWGSRSEQSASFAASPSSSTDRKSTRLNSSHLVISYAVFCLKKKKKTNTPILQSLQQREAVCTPHLTRETQ